MNTETLTLVLISLLIINFAIWVVFLVFLFVKIRKALNFVNSTLENVNSFSNSVVGSSLKLGALVLGLIKGFRTVQSITTLSDIFELDVDKGEKNVKKRK